MVALNSVFEFWAPATATSIARLTNVSRTRTLVSRFDMSLSSGERRLLCTLKDARGGRSFPRMATAATPASDWHDGVAPPGALDGLALGPLERAADHRPRLARVDHVVDHPVP